MIKVHPDKLTQINDNDLKNKYKEVCTKAVSAADSKNWFLMVEAAMDLGIEINEINKEQVKWLKKDCKKIENNIITIKKSIPWVWFHSDNKVKKACMKQYIENYA